MKWSDCLLILLLITVYDVEPGDAQVRSTVSGDDCRKCHEEIVRRLGAKGKAHTPLCLDCHQGHPPADLDIVPSCAACHEGEEHFTIGGCLSCHVDPHAPLEISLTKKITGPCLSCHSVQNEQLQRNPSIHTLLACTACHYYHGHIQPCGNCHMPHSDSMDEPSCHKCHKAHKPLDVNYGRDVSSEECGSCHTGVYADLARTTAKHRRVACIECHPGRHRRINRCEDCHGRPHAEAILRRFSGCGECHGTAHDLQVTAEATNPFIN